jgi:RHS repeat-associated protein
MLTAKVVATGTTVTMDYDDDARPSHVYQASYPTPTTTYTYSPSTGRLASLVDPAGTTSYDYNANGQLIHLTDPFNSTSQVTYGYDSAGRMSTRTDPAGLTWTRTYETGSGRLDAQTIVKAGTTLGSFNLDYDAASNVTSRAEVVKTETGGNNADSGTWTYGYDAANRMTASTAPSGTVTTYGYDGAGNRTSVKVGTANPVTTTYDLAGLPTSSSDNTSYTHDAVGELTKIDKSGGTANDWNLVYSSWGVVKSAAHKTTGTPEVAYTTDALDRVIARVAGSTTTYTYRGAGEDAAKAQVGAATPVFYAFTPGGPLAQRTGTDVTTLRYFVKDLHGDVVGFAATSGTNPMKGSILYSPWGVPGAKTGELATLPAQGRLGFQGQLTDAMTGQVDILTRYYEPTMGRFDTRDVLFGDPANPTSLNQSVYAQSAPVTFTDPTGMKLVGGGGGSPCEGITCSKGYADAVMAGGTCTECGGGLSSIAIVSIPIIPSLGVVRGGAFINQYQVNVGSLRGMGDLGRSWSKEQVLHNGPGRIRSLRRPQGLPRLLPSGLPPGHRHIQS